MQNAYTVNYNDLKIYFNSRAWQHTKICSMLSHCSACYNMLDVNI